jgi:hypothetical protein
LSHQPHTKVIFTGPLPKMEIVTKSKKGNQWEIAVLTFEGDTETIEIKVDKEKGEWLLETLTSLSTEKIKPLSIKEISEQYEQKGLEDFELLWDNKPVNQLYKVGLLHL